MYVIVLVSITVAGNVQNCSGPQVIKLYSFSTQGSVEFQMLIKSKMLKIKTFCAFSRSDVVFIMLINVKIPTIDSWHFNIYENVKMPTIVDILTFMSRINFVLS